METFEILTFKDLSPQEKKIYRDQKRKEIILNKNLKKKKLNPIERFLLERDKKGAIRRF